MKTPILLSLTALGLLPGSLSAQDCPSPSDTCWQNDTLAKVPLDLTGVAVIRGLCVGEAAGKFFPFPGGTAPQRITQVSCGFGWVNLADVAIQVSIEVYEGPVTFHPSGLVTLGTKVYDSLAIGALPPLEKPGSDVGIFTFDLTSENILVNDDFVVAFRMVDNQNGTCMGGYNAGPITDASASCPPEVNLIDELSAGWFDTATYPLFFGSLTVCDAGAYTGNWIIRACTEDSGLATATTMIRNGSGMNPAIYVPLNTPVLGTTWIGQIDIASQGQTMSVIYATAQGPSSGTFLKWGELLIDLSGPGIGPALISNNGLHAVNIPNNLSLAGAIAYTQGGTFQPGQLVFTNAVDLVLGL